MHSEVGIFGFGFDHKDDILFKTILASFLNVTILLCYFIPVQNVNIKEYQVINIFFFISYIVRFIFNQIYLIKMYFTFYNLFKVIFVHKGIILL